MASQWKMTALGALGGATIAVAIVFGAALGGWMPVSGPQIHAYLMDHPGLVVDMMAKAQAEQDAETARAQKEALASAGQKAFFDPRIAFVTGPANAKRTLVEFFDYNCPYCRASLPELKRYYDAHKMDTRFAFIEFPIKGKDSIVAARASLAARKQPDKFLAFHFALMSREELITEPVVWEVAAKVGLDLPKLKADMADKAIDKSIKIAKDLAHRVQIDGTPTFLINGKLRPGMLNDGELKELMQAKAA